MEKSKSIKFLCDEFCVDINFKMDTNRVYRSTLDFHEYCIGDILPFKVCGRIQCDFSLYYNINLIAYKKEYLKIIFGE